MLVNITHFKKIGLRIILLFSLVLLFVFPAKAQIIIKGQVFDISKINPVENVKIYLNDSLVGLTDSLGRYQLPLHSSDSFYFEYQDKPTQKFTLSQVTYPLKLDISLRVSVPSKYSSLKEVTVYAKSYKQDSLENRREYADIFDYRKPGFSTNVGPDGAVGADVNELINIFRFKRNKRLKKFQQRLEITEQEKYINFKFNKLLVKRTINLEPPLLDTFMLWYRPSYEFVASTSEVQLTQYILLANDQFKKIIKVSALKKEEEMPVNK